MGSTATEKLPENVEVIVLDSSGNLRENVGLEDIPGYLSDGSALVWCDIYSTEGGKDGPYGRLLDETFGFDPLTVEDCFTTSHLPKVDNYGAYLFIVLFSFRLSGQERVSTVEMDLYLGENYVVCVHPEPLREMERVREGLRAHDEFVSASAANVAHTVIDAIVDEYLPIMDTLSARVDEIEEALLNESRPANSKEVLDSLFGIKHLLTSLRRLAIPERDTLADLSRPTTELVPSESRMYFQDIQDHLNRVVDSMDTMRDYLAGAQDIYTTRATQRINEGLQKLTAISTIVLPLTLVTGIYGMNFDNMPELSTEYGYFVTLGVLVALAALMLYYLHRQRML